ncbi:MAG: dihydropteroate synthase [Clostridia bacterium]|nr:dihydropteroate synthase [Clostridia bacterium]
MIIGNKALSDGKTYVMAIINLTPDSFYDKSRCAQKDVLRRVERAVEDGADIIDVGAQSTRPGYTEIPAAEEIKRFSGAVRDIKKNFDVPLSVDTYFSESARVALDLGADMINDVWGLTHDEGMAKAIASYGASVCIMHNSVKPLEGDIWGPITKFLSSSVRLALDSGIERDRICLDGGVGFAKNREQNLELVRGYARLKKLGYPLLLGTSRKSLFGGDVEGRLSQTLETTRAAARDGIMIVRVHDVKENVEAIKSVKEERK